MAAYGVNNHAVAVTPSDTVELAQPSAIYVGGAGDVAVETVDETTVIFHAVPAGTVLPVQVTRVNATNTTATLMVACWL